MTKAFVNFVLAAQIIFLGTAISAPDVLFARFPADFVIQNRAAGVSSIAFGFACFLQLIDCCIRGSKTLKAGCKDKDALEGLVGGCCGLCQSWMFSMTCQYAVFFDTKVDLSADKLYAQSGHALIAVSFCTGYIIYDSARLLIRNISGIEMILHHLFSVICLYVTMSDVTVYFGLLLAWAMEITSIFLNNMEIIKCSGNKDHVAFVPIALSFTFSYLIFRVLVCLYLAYDFFMVLRNAPPGSVDTVMYCAIVGLLSFVGLNMFWFTKVFKGLLKFLKKGEVQEPEGLRKKQKQED